MYRYLLALTHAGGGNYVGVKVAIEMAKHVSPENYTCASRILSCPLAPPTLPVSYVNSIKTVSSSFSVLNWLRNAINELTVM